jgi:indolepyruvate decarboxylase
LPRIFSRDKNSETYVVRTGKELQQVLDAPHSELVLVEAILDKYDSPIDLIRGGHAFAETDYGPRGPQSRPDAQILLDK